MVNDTAHENWECCTTLNKWKDPIGNVCIYDIMGPTPRRYRGDEEEWGDDDTGVPLMGATFVAAAFPLTRLLALSSR